MNPNALAMVSVAIFAALPLSPAIAQPQPPNVATDSAPAAQLEAPKKAVARKEARALKANADARLCLEFPTERMVIACAEKYRLDKSGI